MVMGSSTRCDSSPSATCAVMTNGASGTVSATFFSKMSVVPLFGVSTSAEPPAIAELAQAAGFHYVRDPASGQYAHPAGVLLLTPAGRIARYFAGVDFPERELKYGLIEASSNRIGSPVDRLWLL